MKTEPPKNTKAEMPKPPQPKIDPNKPELPRNPSKWERFKFGAALTIRVLEKLLKTVQIMVDPEVLAEIACRENPYGDDCARMLLFVRPQRRCVIAPKTCIGT
jgi:hypothetical protein